MSNFKKYGNIMVDLETLSTHTNASIIEIGAVEFNKYTGETGDTFDIIIDPQDWGKNDRHIDGNTIQWWFSQSESARKRFGPVTNRKNTKSILPLESALIAFSEFVRLCDNTDKNSKERVVVWGNGATMDITILQNAYEYFGKKTPWQYWAVNDVRTIVDLNPTIKDNTEFIETVKHSAVSDCLHEIKYTVKTIISLGNGKSTN